MVKNTDRTSTWRAAPRAAALAALLALAIAACIGPAGGNSALAAEGVAAANLSTAVVEAPDSQAGTALGAQADSDAVSTHAEAVQAVRTAMMARKTSISVKVKTSLIGRSPTSEQLQAYGSRLLLDAFAETDDPYAGDYLRYSIGTSADISVSCSASGGEATIAFTIPYLTTASQEAALKSKVTSIYTGIAASWGTSTTDLQKAQDIHDWICKNVAYDTSATVPAVSHSAYGAVMNKRAVCQGYAALFYVLARKAGLDARIIGGWGVQGTRYEQHAWNLVSVDGGTQYHGLDATWDSSAYYAKGDWQRYFLNNDTTFTNSHQPVQFSSLYPSYTSSAFTSAYKTQYTYEQASAATCTLAGMKAHWKTANGSTYYSSLKPLTSVSSADLKTTAALGHSYGAYRTVVAPTATAAGKESRTCTRCKHAEVRTVPKLATVAKVAKPRAKTGLSYTGRQLTGVAGSSAYAISGNTGVKAGTYYATATLRAGYAWTDGTTSSVRVRWTIAKAKNPLAVVAAAKQLSASSEKNSAFAAGKAFRVSKAQGKLTFAKVSGLKQATVAKSGKVTVKKGAKKGAYTVKVRVKAAGNGNYAAASKVVALKVKVV